MYVFVRRHDTSIVDMSKKFETFYMQISVFMHVFSGFLCPIHFPEVGNFFRKI